MVERTVLGWSKIDEAKRTYLPRTLRRMMQLKVGDGIQYKAGKNVLIERTDSENGCKIDKKKRVYVPTDIRQRLKLRKGSDVTFILERSGKVSMRRLTKNLSAA